MDLELRRLDEVASASVASVSTRATVSDAATASADVAWVVVTGTDQRPVGLVPAVDLKDADGAVEVGTLVSGPLVMQPGRRTVGEAIRDTRFTAHKGMMTEILGIVVVTDDGSQPLGVWSGPEFNQYLITGVRGSIDTKLGGAVGIDNLTQRCRYTEGVRACTSTEEFAEMPDDMPSCANPDHLAAHKFVWE
jgi:hypothetical protein